jgi:hypothetical protein
MAEYTNRYGDVFTFTKQEDGSVLWEGNFEYCRFGMPNDYTDAYRAYTANGGLMGLKEFKEEVHRSVYDENDNYIGPCDISRVYGKLVKSKKDVIDMVDPSGGPYIKAGQMLSHVVFDDEFNVIVESFEPIETGYLIKTKPHEYDPNDMSHLEDRNIIGGII